MSWFLEELGFATAVSGGGAAVTNLALNHNHSTGCCYVLYPEWVQGKLKDRIATATVFSCVQSVPLASEMFHLAAPAQILPSSVSKTLVGLGWFWTRYQPCSDFQWHQGSHLLLVAGYCIWIYRSQRQVWENQVEHFRCKNLWERKAKQFKGL